MVDQDLENLCAAINGFETVGKLEGFENLRMTMHKVLQHAIKSSKIKDEFDFFWNTGPQVITVLAKSLKTKVDYSFFYDYHRNTLHFDSFINNPYNLKNLQDHFLIDFFKICEQNKFKYEQNSFSPNLEKKFPDLHKTFKGNIFRLMRNYFLLITDENRDNKEDLDLGYFSASWSFDKDIDSIYGELSLAMKWFYKFNYNLWKIEELKKPK